ncbi:phosphatase PAP2 family protein [Treponema parvum]|uniref:phosphatase PAP2 family protein n=1 Tax=Treponema parvum TaxID=138851 RepID=UPI001AEC1CAD|nr:phosphatase PAP2 family protein [Treponema parvum]QTQ16019.1 phosphatase PAP2 family protein [Treponema parvum]
MTLGDIDICICVHNNFADSAFCLALKKIRFLFICALLLVSEVFTFAKEAVFSLSPKGDSVAVCSGLALEAVSLLMNNPEWDGVRNSKDGVNSFDAKFMHKYDRALDVSGDVLFGALAAGQLVLTFTAERQEWFPVLVMAAETVLITDGTKRILKKSASRMRPYTYFEDPPSDSDAAASWPSGHSMNGFAIASFSSYVFSQYYPDSPWKWAVTGGAFGIAAVTAASRVFAGCHFVSDTLSGAAFGSAIGFLVPFLHTNRFLGARSKTGETVQLALIPSGIMLSVHF